MKKNKHFTSMRDIAHELARKHKFTDKATGEFILQFIDRMWDHLLSGHRVQIRGLGTFHYRRSVRHGGYWLYFTEAKKALWQKNKFLTF